MLRCFFLRNVGKPVLTRLEGGGGVTIPPCKHALSLCRSVLRMLRTGKCERRNCIKITTSEGTFFPFCLNARRNTMHLHTVALSVSHHSCLSSPVTEVNLNMSFTLSFMFTSRRRLEKRKFSNLLYNTLEDKKVNIVSTIGCDRATNPTNKCKFICKRFCLVELRNFQIPIKILFPKNSWNGQWTLRT